MPISSQISSFGYRLHGQEGRGSPVSLEGVPQIPTAADQWIKSDSEAALSPDLEAQCTAQIESAKKVLFARHIDQLRGNSYGRHSRFAHDDDDEELD